MFSIDAIVKSLGDALYVIADIFIKFVQRILSFFGASSQHPPQPPETRERILRAWITVLLFAIVASILIQNEFLTLVILQKKVGLLKDLNEAANNAVTSKKELEPIYYDLVQQLTQGKANAMITLDLSTVLSNFNAFVSTPLFWFKFLSGATFGLLLVIWTLREHKGKAEKRQAFRGALLVTTIFGIVGASIPLVLKNEIISLLLNSFVLIVVQVVLLSYIGRRSKFATDPT